MKVSEVEVGGYYRVRVSTRITTVVVERELKGYGRPGSARRYSVRDVGTKRQFMVTAARLRERLERRDYEYSEIFGHCLKNRAGDITSCYAYDWDLGRWKAAKVGPKPAATTAELLDV